MSDRLFKGETAFFKEVTQHGTDDDFWKARNIRPHLKNIKPAVMTVGGWFDAENLFGSLEVYKNVAKNSPGTSNRLVMGPWVHGGWARAATARSWAMSRSMQKQPIFTSEQIELPFFEYHLKGKGKPEDPKAWVFETGTNVWRKYATWPPKNARSKSLYFQTGGKLADALPSAATTPQKAQQSRRDDFDEYLSDPARPVPFMDGVMIGMAKEYMTADQRFASRRPDVLVYTGQVLDEDLTIAGPIKVDLVVSTTGTDSDWIVKLIDVYPNDYPDPSPNPSGVRMGGYQQLVRGDVMRGKFRNSFEKPEPFVRNKPTPVKFTMQDVFHTFRSGHRVMVQVQSSWFPLVDRNPQVFVDIYGAKESDYHRATEPRLPLARAAVERHRARRALSRSNPVIDVHHLLQHSVDERAVGNGRGQAVDRRHSPHEIGVLAHEGDRLFQVGDKALGDAGFVCDATSG